MSAPPLPPEKAKGTAEPSPSFRDHQSPSPPPAHQMDADEEDENVKQLEECSALYLALQECLVNTNRDWRLCQPDVQALKACHARKNSGRKK